jgi:hypothetical protein
MKNKWMFLTLLFLLLAATFIIGCEYGEMRSVGQEISPDTITVSDTIWNTDTFNVVKPIPKYITKLRTDTVFSEEGDTIQLVTENKTYQDTLICDKDTAELQIFTSGIKSNVDSINLKLRKSEIIKTNTVEKIKYIEKKKLFRIQPQVTYGYDLINHQWGIIGGIGVGIDF